MKNHSIYFEPSYVYNPASPLNTIKSIMPPTLIERYEESIAKADAEGILKEYIKDFLSDKNKKYHGPLTTKFFRTALSKAKPELIEWFDVIQVLR